MRVRARAAAIKKWPCSRKPRRVGRLSAASSLDFEEEEFVWPLFMTNADWVA